MRAVDGDTLQIGRRVVKLEGIDAPEMKQRCMDIREKEFACGRQAKQELAAMLKSDLECRKTRVDPYNRDLAFCTAGGVNLNREMVRQGWARAFVKYNSIFLPDELAARTAKRGLWRGEFQAPWEWRQARIAEYAPRSECVIKGNVSKHGRIYFMQFHLDYKLVKISPERGERFFCTEQEAQAAGWRRSLR